MMAGATMDASRPVLFGSGRYARPVQGLADACPFAPVDSSDAISPHRGGGPAGVTKGEPLQGARPDRPDLLQWRNGGDETRFVGRLRLKGRSGRRDAAQ